MYWIGYSNSVTSQYLQKSKASDVDDLSSLFNNGIPPIDILDTNRE